MRPEAHGVELWSDSQGVALVCERIVGYVARTGIEEGAVPVREVVNSHVLAAISTDDDSEMIRIVVLNWTLTAVFGFPQDNAKQCLVAECGGSLFAG